MISKEEFISKVKAEVFPKLLATEQERKKTLWLARVKIIICVIMVATMLYSYRRHGRTSLIADFIPLIAFILLLIIARKGFFLDKQKQTFSSIFLKFLGNLKNTQTAIDESLLKHSCLFNGLFDDIEYEDCLSGTFDKTRFSLAEIILSQKESRYRSSNIFEGIFIDIPMKLPVSGYTLLYNTKMPYNIPVLQKIRPADVVFSNYQVFSNNLVNVQLLLTPAFMEKLKNIKKCFNNTRIDVSFFGNHVLFAIHTKHNFFESYSLHKNVTDIKTYEEFYDDIRAIYDMIKILNVNNQSLTTDCTYDKTLYQKIVQKQIKKLYITMLIGCALILPLNWYLFYPRWGVLLAFAIGGLIFCYIYSKKRF